MRKNTKICVVGLGYVGLPLALKLSKSFKTIGFDIDSKRISDLSKGIDLNSDLNSFNLNKKLFFTNSINDIHDCNFYIITVPTPVKKKKLTRFN